jgi:integrase
LARTSGTVAANRARAHLSATFSWAIRAGLVDHNPVVGTVKGVERSRERVLAPDELRTIWKACLRQPAFGGIVRLLMLTGARKGEVGGMLWAELDLDKALWSLPGERTKNGRPHEVPLSRQALEVLAEFRNLPRCPYISGRRGQRAFSGWSRTKQILDAQAPLAAWTLHDIRRSVVTHMADLGIAPPHIIEAIVGHASGHKGGVAGVYNRGEYRDAKRVALQAWADWLEATVEDRKPAGNVVTLRA